jgi:PD-(D/E)XK nuclease superfamily
MIKQEYPHSELTGKIIGCAMEVHKALGNGFQEVIYQRSLAHEMGLQGISFSREFEMPVLYKDAQAINYLEAYNVQVGLLINFGARSLEFKRLQNKKFKNVVLKSRQS